MSFNYLKILLSISLSHFISTSNYVSAQYVKFDRGDSYEKTHVAVSYDSLERKFVYFLDNDIDSALIVLAHLKYQAQDKIQKAKVELNWGTYHQRINQFDSALYHYHIAKRLFEKYHYILGIISVQNNLGTLYQEKQQFDSALFYLSRNIQMSDSLGYEIEYSKSLLNIGLIYQNQELYEEAANFYHRSLKIKNRLNDQKGIALIYNNLAIIKYNEDSINKAIEYFLLALASYHEIKDLRGLSRTYFNIGEIYFYDIRNITKALFYYHKAYDIEHQLMDFSGQSLSLIRLADCQFQLGNLKEAIKLLEKSAALSKAISKYDIYQEAMLTLAAICESMGDFRCATASLKKAYTINDSLMQEEKKKQFLALTAKYENRLREIEDTMIRKELGWSLLQNNYATLIYVLVIMLIIAISVFGFIIFRSWKRLKSQQRKIETLYSLNNQDDQIIFLKHDEEAQKKKILSDILRLLESMERSILAENYKDAQKAKAEILKNLELCVCPKFETLLINFDVRNKQNFEHTFETLKNQIKQSSERINENQKI